MVISVVIVLTIAGIAIGGAIFTVLAPSLLVIAALMPLSGYSFGYVLSAIFRLSQL